MATLLGVSQVALFRSGSVPNNDPCQYVTPSLNILPSLSGFLGDRSITGSYLFSQEPVLTVHNLRSAFLPEHRKYHKPHCYKTFRRIPPPSTDGADSSCWVGENDCFIWAGNLCPQVPKFSAITGNFRRFLL
jgi:hypothetical protein